MNLIAQFEINALPKTINQIGRKHWAIKYNEAKRWKALVYEMCVLHKLSALNLTQARLELTRYSAIEPDFDNLASSFKHVIDGLVAARVITDDKPSVIGSPIFRWLKCPKKEGKIEVKVFSV